MQAIASVEVAVVDLFIELEQYLIEEGHCPTEGTTQVIGFNRIHLSRTLLSRFNLIEIDVFVSCVEHPPPNNTNGKEQNETVIK